MVSDKIEHGLWAVYLEQLPEKCDLAVEIGVYLGDGMRLLREKYPQARIIGVDILPRPDTLEAQYEYHAMQQTDPRLVTICADADVVIDDASHIPHLTLQTWQLIWPRLKSGATYWIEDWTPWMKPEMSAIIDTIESRGVQTDRFIIAETDSAVARFTKS